MTQKEKIEQLEKEKQYLVSIILCRRDICIALDDIYNETHIEFDQAVSLIRDSNDTVRDAFAIIKLSNAGISIPKIHLYIKALNS